MYAIAHAVAHSHDNDMHLWMIRHAQPVVAAGMCYGVLDVPADVDANEQAAQQLAHSLPQALHVMHSPALRCTQLAQRLHALRPDLQLLQEPDLREMDFGQWEGQLWANIDPQQLKAWTDDFENYHCGGDGECVRDVLQRVQRAAQRTAQLIAVSTSAGVDLDAAALSPLLAYQPQAAWITHAGVLRATAWLAPRFGWSHPLLSPLCLRADAWPQDALPFGECRSVHWPSHPSSR
jgi:alpha-ribazole phosphatase